MKKDEDKVPLVPKSVAAVDKLIYSVLDSTPGVAQPIASGAQAIASIHGQIFHQQSYGYTCKPPQGRPIHTKTLFDLSSLTKILVTSQALMWLYSQQRIRLQLPLADVLPFTSQHGLGERTVTQLLDHSSGLPPTCTETILGFAETYGLHPTIKGPQYHRQQHVVPQIRSDLEHWMVTKMPLQPVGEQMIYSDINYILLGWVLERVLQQPLHQWFLDVMAKRLGLAQHLRFLPHDKEHYSPTFLRDCAATEQCSWRQRLIQGEVHDKSAWALGGVSGHAGLFGNAYSIWKLCLELVEAYHGKNKLFSSAAVKKFWTRTEQIPGSTRTLGWDTPTKYKSSAGRLLPLTSVGHLGFTGASVWIEPRTGFIGILLLNRAYPHPEGKEASLFQLRSQVFSIWSKFLQAHV